VIPYIEEYDENRENERASMKAESSCQVKYFTLESFFRIRTKVTELCEPKERQNFKQ
jgi:hypothetical protein